MIDGFDGWMDGWIALVALQKMTEVWNETGNFEKKTKLQKTTFGGIYARQGFCRLRGERDCGIHKEQLLVHVLLVDTSYLPQSV